MKNRVNESIFDEVSNQVGNVSFGSNILRDTLEKRIKINKTV